MSKFDRYQEERSRALAIVPRLVLADAIRSARAYGLSRLACGLYAARACRARGEAA